MKNDKTKLLQIIVVSWIIIGTLLYGSIKQKFTILELSRKTLQFEKEWSILETKDKEIRRILNRIDLQKTLTDSIQMNIFYAEQEIINMSVGERFYLMK